MGFFSRRSGDAPAVADVSFYGGLPWSAAVSWEGDDALWVHGPAIYLDWAVNKGLRRESEEFLSHVRDFLAQPREDSPFNYYVAQPLLVPYASLIELPGQHEGGENARVTVSFAAELRCNASFRPRRMITDLLFSTFWALWNGLVLEIGFERKQWGDIDALRANLELQLDYYAERGFGAFRGGIAPIIGALSGASSRGAEPPHHEVSEPDAVVEASAALPDSNEWDSSPLDEKAQYVAKHIVDARLAERCNADLAYVDNGTRLVLVAIHTFGTERIPVERIEQLAREWLLQDA
jgi:hypothetical protein